jgi:hypothetical protein
MYNPTTGKIEDYIKPSDKQEDNEDFVQSLKNAKENILKRDAMYQGIPPKGGNLIKIYEKEGTKLGELWLAYTKKDRTYLNLRFMVPSHPFKANYCIRLYLNFKIKSDRDSSLLKKNFPDIYSKITKDVEEYIKKLLSSTLPSGN